MVKHTAILITASIMMFLCVACQHVEKDWVSIDKINANHVLTDFDDCKGVEAYVKNAATQLMLAKVQSTYDEMMSNTGKGGLLSNEGAGVAAGDDEKDANLDNDTNHSETNNQEQGVDEADIVKTDGEYIYVLHLGELVILKIDHDGKMTEAGRADVGGYALELFIKDDTAVVFSRMKEDQVPKDLRYKTSVESPKPGVSSDKEDGYYYENDRYSQIALVDISDKSNPNVLRTIIYAAKYTTSRLIDGVVRAVFFSPVPVLETTWNWDNYPYEKGNYTKSDIDDWCNEQADLNNERFETLSLDDIIPNKFDSAMNSVEPMVDCASILGPGTPEGIGVTTMVSVDLSTFFGDTNETAVFGGQGLVYASKTAIYLTTSRDYVITAINSGMWKGESSGIYKFDISNNTLNTNYIAAGSVPGRMLNQFCLSEYKNNLRVVTTTGRDWKSNTLENHVSVLDSKLQTLGHLGGLGKGEEIYAARFIGDRGFMVTFYETDPLYTLDMSDPTAPRAIGEWHGPGYSTYLHPIGENHLLSVGLEEWKVAISLYDMSDFSTPTLVKREFLPKENYQSAAVKNHKAFMFKTDDNLLVLPYSDWDSNDTGLLLYNVDDSGIEHTGTMLMQLGKLKNEGSAVRSVYIGDNLFGLSRCRVTSALLTNPETTIETQKLYTNDVCNDSFFGNYGEFL